MFVHNLAQVLLSQIVGRAANMFFFSFAGISTSGWGAQLENLLIRFCTKKVQNNTYKTRKESICFDKQKNLLVWTAVNE